MVVKKTPSLSLLPEAICEQYSFAAADTAVW